MSCSDINKVKTDGTRVLNGKTVQALYVDVFEFTLGFVSAKDQMLTATDTALVNVFK